MKQVIHVNTLGEAIKMAREISNDYAVLIAENEYDSDKHFKGVIIYVK